MPQGTKQGTCQPWLALKHEDSPVRPHRAFYPPYRNSERARPAGVTPTELPSHKPWHIPPSTLPYAFSRGHKRRHPGSTGLYRTPSSQLHAKMNVACISSRCLIVTCSRDQMFRPTEHINGTSTWRIPTLSNITSNSVPVDPGVDLLPSPPPSFRFRCRPTSELQQYSVMTPHPPWYLSRGKPWLLSVHPCPASALQPAPPPTPPLGSYLLELDGAGLGSR